MKRRNHQKKKSLVNRKVVAYLLASVALSVLFSFCNRPKEVLSRKDMEKLMYDVYMAEAIIENDYQNFDTPEKKEALINEVFKKHKISQAQWDTSLSWYSDKIDIYLKMNDSVKVRLKRRQQASEQIMSREYAREQLVSQRSHSPSYVPQNYSFDETNPKNGFRFRLDSADIAQKITAPDFYFMLDVIGIPAHTSPNLRMWLMLEYKDTTIYQSGFVSENTNYSLHGQKYAADDTLRKITGFVRLQDTTGIYRHIRLNHILLGNSGDTLQRQEEDVSLSRKQRMDEKQQPQ